MPSISQATNADLTGYSPVQPGSSPAMQTPSINTENEPGLNPMTRSPIPPIFQASADSLRQFFLGSKLPQTRLLGPLPTNLTSGAASNAGAGVVVNGGNVSGQPASTLASKLTATASVTLGPGQKYYGEMGVSTSFQLLGITANNPCRIELYGTQWAQYADAGRVLDMQPPTGTTQNVISDVVLDTSPYQWTFQNRVGANADSPQAARVYVTITNIAETSVPIMVTLQYVPLESSS